MIERAGGWPLRSVPLSAECGHCAEENMIYDQLPRLAFRMQRCYDVRRFRRSSAECLLSWSFRSLDAKESFGTL